MDVWVRLCGYVCVCLCVCMSACMCVYGCLCVCMHVCVYRYVCVCVDARLCFCPVFWFSMRGFMSWCACTCSLRRLEDVRTDWPGVQRPLMPLQHLRRLMPFLHPFL